MNIHPACLSANVLQRSVVVVLIQLLSTLCLTAQDALHLQSNWWDVNGTVRAIARRGDTLYVGGSFNYIGPNEPYGTIVSEGTGIPDFSTLNPNGSVVTAIPDGVGGWYIGGSFSQVGGQMRDRLARINADGSLHPWHQSMSGYVRALALSGNTLYVGGDFTSMGGQPRNNLGALDATTGDVTPWDPNASSGVSAIAVSGNTVYVGGGFKFLGGPGGPTRLRIAALNATTGEATSWNPSSSGSVHALAVVGNTVYAGGDFVSIGGQARSRIAALAVSTGNATAWNPNASDIVRAIEVSGSRLYVAGDFVTIGGQPRNRIAALDITTGNATAFNPDANDTVFDLAVSGSAVYVGGEFTSIGGLTTYYLAGLDATTGALTSWNPNTRNVVKTLAVSGSNVYVGGLFLSIGGHTCRNLAALDMTTGVATSWNPFVDNLVYALAVAGNKVYVGGSFTGYLRALDAVTGQLTNLIPNVNSHVAALAVSGSTVYVGGSFTTIAGQARNRIAALDATTGALTAWNPSSNQTVRTITVSGNTIYVGGFFDSIGGQTRNRIAALDATTGSATSWNPNGGGGGPVNAIEVNDSTVYLAGEFSYVGGQTRNRIAAVDAATGAVTPWNPFVDGSALFALAVSGSTLYVGGAFHIMGGQPINDLAALDVVTGAVTSWNPNSTGIIYDILVSTNAVCVGGLTSFWQGQYQMGVAAFSTSNIPAVTTELATNVCLGVSGTVSYSATGAFEPENVFTAQMSNAAGVFDYPVNIGTLASTTSGSIDITIPPNTSPGSGYRIRVVSSNPTITGPDNGSDIGIHFLLEVTQTPAYCDAPNGTLNSSISGGTAPYSYLWSNGATTANLEGLDPGDYSLNVTDNNGCTQSATATILDDSTFNPSVGIGGQNLQPGNPCVISWTLFPPGSEIDISVSADGGSTWLILLTDQVPVDNDLVTLPASLAAGQWLLKAESDNGCVAIHEFTASSVVQQNRIDFYENVEPNTSANPLNVITPGLPLRFKLRVGSLYYSNNSSTLTALGATLRSESPWVTIIDSLSAYNPIGYGQQLWGEDEFEILIDPDTPDGAEALFEVWLEDEIAPDGPWGSSFTIPLAPFQSQYQPINDDAFSDSNGDGDNIAEPGETIEITPLLENISAHTIYHTSAQLISPYSGVNVWNNIQGADAMVWDTCRYNVDGQNWQPVSPYSTSNIPEEDFVFDYNSEQAFGITLCMVVTGYLDEAMGVSNQLGGVLHRWSTCFFMSDGFPNVDTTSTDLTADRPLQYGYTIYPNPASSELHILPHDPLSVQGYVATLTDMSGRRVQEVRAFGAVRTTLELSAVPPGFYTLSLRSGQRVLTRKVVVSR